MTFQTTLLICNAVITLLNIKAVLLGWGYIPSRKQMFSSMHIHTVPIQTRSNTISHLSGLVASKWRKLKNLLRWKKNSKKIQFNNRPGITAALTHTVIKGFHPAKLKAWENVKYRILFSDILISDNSFTLILGMRRKNFPVSLVCLPCGNPRHSSTFMQYFSYYSGCIILARFVRTRGRARHY